MSAIRNKQRLIHLYRYMMKNTDEEHQATTNELVEFLRKEDANVSRKTVKDDIDVLIEEGIDIVVTKSFYNSYFVGDRMFEVPEIKLLADGIASSKSISTEKKKEIIRKLLSLLSVHQAEKIERLLHFDNNVSSVSEQLYYTIDKISDAISEKRKIEFCYLGPAKDGGKKEKKHVILTPVVIKSSNNHFYVCGYCKEGGKPDAYRLDRMRKTKVLEESGDPQPDRARLDRYLRSLFDMETGEMTDVTLECSDEIAEVIRERFGQEMETWRSTQDKFYIRVPITVSSAFYGWVFRFGGKVRIAAPATVREAYLHKAAEIIKSM